MLDMKFVRDNPEKVIEAVRKRNGELNLDEFLALDKERREITQQVEALSSQVNAGKILKARAISLTAHYSNDKVGDRHGRVQYMVANLTLVENSLADHGPVRVYVRVKDPDGVLLLNSESMEFTVDAATLQATASREVDYEGQEVDLSIYINDTGEFIKGIYTMEVFTEKSLLGRAECMLR